MRVELFCGRGWQPWRFRAIAGNGEVVAVSEGYVTKWNAKRAARKVFPTAQIVG